MRTLKYTARPGDTLVIPTSEDPIESGEEFTVEDEMADRLLADGKISVSEVKTANPNHSTGSRGK